MTGTALAGVLPVLSTPFTADDEIDEEVVAGEVDWLIGCGADGITVAMVSEVLRLSDIERRDLTCMVVAAAGGKVPVVCSVGAESTRASVALAEHAQQAGAAAVMAIPPALVPLPDSEVRAFYEAVLAGVDLPVVVQDASGYLGQPLSIELCAALLERHGPDRVLFKPEAEPIGPRLSSLLAATGGQARIFEGTGGAALVDSHRRGVVGTMPGPEVPWALVALWRALERGQDELVTAIQEPLAALISLQGSLDSFVAVEKYLLVRQGVLVDARRRHPYGFEIDRETAAEADRLLHVLLTVLPVPPKPSR